MELFELNPYIRYAVKHNGVFRPRRNISICYDARLFYFENLNGSITVNGQRHEITNKTAIYLPPLSKYIFNLKFSGDLSVYVINFDLVNNYRHLKGSLGTATVSDFNESKSPKYELPPELSLPQIKHLPKLSGLLGGCIEDSMKNDRVAKERASALLKLALLEFIDSDNLVRSPICKKIIKYIEENFADSMLTNESIAEHFNYHPYYINRVVKRELLMSLRSYIIDYRLNAAKELLVSTDFNISEIAFKVGFASSSYFVKIFRERVGSTPKEYRNMHMKFEI